MVNSFCSLDSFTAIKKEIIPNGIRKNFNSFSVSLGNLCCYNRIGSCTALIAKNPKLRVKK